MNARTARPARTARTRYAEVLRPTDDTLRERRVRTPRRADRAAAIRESQALTS